MQLFVSRLLLTYWLYVWQNSILQNSIALWSIWFANVAMVVADDLAPISMFRRQVICKHHAYLNMVTDEGELYYVTHTHIYET